jgi:uncharacterized delta-60 repeat protein
VQRVIRPRARHTKPAAWKRGALLFGVVAITMVALQGAAAAPADLDPTFGGDGVVTLNTGPSVYSTDRLEDAALDASGRIVAAGSIDHFSDFVVVRLEADGTLDRAFSGDGFAVIKFTPDGRETARAVAADSQGRIVAVGGTEFLNENHSYLITRLLPDGTLDPSFGNGGKVVTDFGGDGGEAYDVAIDSAGRIVVVGASHTGEPGPFHKRPQIGVARYLADGTPDSTFGTNGLVSLGRGAEAWAKAVAIGAADTITFAGYASGGGGFLVGRLTSSGAPDPSFGEGGLTELLGIGHMAEAVAVESGKTVVAGGDGFGDLVVARLLNEGTLDQTFSNDGWTMTNVVDDPTPSFDTASGITLDGSKILVVGDAGRETGVANNPRDTDFAAVRYLDDGTLDASFDGDGILVTAVPPAKPNLDDDSAVAGLLPSSGGLLLVGQSEKAGLRSTQQSWDVAVASYSADGTLDTAFGDGGVAVSNLRINGMSDDHFEALAPAGDKIVAAGRALDDVGGFLVVRYAADGSLDATFSGDGFAIARLAGSNDLAEDVAVEGDGTVVVAGSAGDPAANGQIGVARFQPDGTLDPTFDGDGIRRLGNPDELWYANGVAVDNQRRILLTGFRYTNTFEPALVVARLKPDGSLDETFAGDGIFLVTPGDVPSPLGDDVALDTSGRIVVSGTADGDVLLIRLRPDGTLDPEFDADGIVTSDFGGSESTESLTLAPGDKIVVAGAHYGTVSSMLVGRYLPDGSLDPSFDEDGWQTVDVPGGNGFATAVAADTAGRVVLAGDAYDINFENSVIALARLTASGAPDGAFDGDGRLTHDLGNDELTTASLVDEAGRILVAGGVRATDAATGVTSLDAALVRFEGDPPGPTNRAPTLTNPGAQVSREGRAVSLQLEASDPDGDTLTYSTTGLPPGLSLDAATGRISGTLTSASAGFHTVAATVSDGSLTDQESFTWTVADRSCTIVGTNAGETLVGTAANDVICGLGGDDVLRGADGNDILEGDQGDDDVSGDAGTDRARYDFAPAAVSVDLHALAAMGGDGRDTLASIEETSGSAFDDKLTGSDGEDRLLGNGGDDALSGVGGGDILHPGAGNDSVAGGDGTDDFVAYGDAAAGVSVDLAAGVATGGSGNDALATVEGVGGSGFDDVLIGNAEANVLLGFAGLDTITGAAGTDELYGGLGDDSLAGNAGDDFARYDSAPAAVRADLTAGTATGGDGNDSLATVENLAGSAFADTLRGNTGRNVIFGLAGNDSVFADDGADFLSGGEGDDLLLGDNGDDAVAGRAGADRLAGGAGFDYGLYDFAPAAVRADLTAGTATGGDGSDSLSMLEGLIGSPHGDTLIGNAGANALEGRAGNDSVSAGDGADFLSGGDGDDSLAGENGDDDLAGRAGADTVAGGAGFDYGRYDFAPAAVRADLTAGTATGGDGSDSLSMLEGLIGSPHGDTLIGNAGANTLFGREGPDSLSGQNGDDGLDGGLGNDNVVGGTGLDFAAYTAAPAGVSANLATGTTTGGYGNDTLATIEILVGSNFADTLTGDGNVNLLFGLPGDDRLIGGGGFDLVSYSTSAAAVTVNLGTGTARGDGNDTLETIEGVVGSRSNDTLLGDAIANVLDGGDGDDVLRGRGGNDSLYGRNGNDSLFGEAGNDFLDGGPGNDSLDGGIGTDRCIQGGGSGPRSSCEA